MENNGKGIFYGVIGVATLIVAIIGATFAYFTATTASGQYVQGTAATAGLAVTVTRLTGHSTADTAENYVMVPQKDAYLNLAITGVTVEEGEDKTSVRKACIDTAGSLVCSIYKITVENTGSAAIDVSGSIKFFASGDALIENGEDVEYTTEAANLMQHLKWSLLSSPSGNDPIPTALKTSGQYLYAMKVNAALYAEGAVGKDGKDNGYAAFDDEAVHDAHYDLINPADDLDSDLAVDDEALPGQIHLEAADSTVGSGEDLETIYIVVWISENNKPQNDYNYGTFLGQVTFNSVDGSGATSTFNETYGA